MTTKDTLRSLDATIAKGLGAAGLLDSAVIDDATDAIEGYYTEEFVEAGAGEDAIPGLHRTFDCRTEDLPADLEPEASVVVAGYGTYRYLRSELYGNGRTLLILGTVDDG